MRIKSFNQSPVAKRPYLDAGSGGPVLKEIPVFKATVDTLPAGTDAIIATADLQGRGQFHESSGYGLPLIGEILPQWLADEVLPDLGHSDRTRVGVFLCGDFFTDPVVAKRGASGDVINVWRAFRSCFSWVAGVPGNHDTFGDSTSGKDEFSRGQRIFYLDGKSVDVDGMAIAGLGGIISGRNRPHRRSEEDYLRELAALLQKGPSVVMLHDGPDAPGCKGSAEVRKLVEKQRPTLIVRGHAHWDTRLVTFSNGMQVLNVHECVVVLSTLEPE